MISESLQAGALWPFARPLYDIANAFESALDAEMRIRRVLELLRQLVPYDRCALLETQPELERRLVVVPEPGPAGERVALIDILGKLLELISEQHSKPEVLSPRISLKKWDAHLAVPLVGLDQVIGLLFVGRNGSPYEERDLCLLSIVAAQTAAYLTTRRLREEERTARQEAEAANRAKDEFIAMISHELRTPLTAIVGWAHILSTGVLEDARRVRAIETIKRNAGAQSRILEDLIDLSRITTGKLRLDMRPLELGALVEGAVEGARLHAESKSIFLDSAGAPAAVEVLGDSDRLQQVISNLLANAIKFTPSGGTIAVQLACVAGMARVQVCDTGKGISAELLPYIFARFRQADSASKRGQDGLGLGLAISQSLVELHGGQIRAESPGEGQGATFTVTLPLAG